MTQRFLVFGMVGGVCGFGAAFLEYPGIFLAVVMLLVLAGTVRQPADLLRVGAYLFGAGLVAFSIIGPARNANYVSYVATWGYATAAVLGALIVALAVILQIRRGQAR